MGLLNQKKEALFHSIRESTEMKQAAENLANAEMKLQEAIFQLGQLYYSENKG